MEDIVLYWSVAACQCSVIIIVIIIFIINLGAQPVRKCRASFSD